MVGIYLHGDLHWVHKVHGNRKLPLVEEACKKGAEMHSH